mgnify:CR=1 FL=1
MKDIVCKSYGQPENHVLEEIDDHVEAADQELVQDYCASMTFTDGVQIQGKYQ